MSTIDNKQVLKSLAKSAQDKDPVSILRLAVDHFGAASVALASSLGAEDQVLTQMVRTQFPQVNIFSIDTGRLPQETHDVMRETAKAYGFSYDVLHPDENELSPLIARHGLDMFYESVELRKACCHARKITPLQKKLRNLSAWICGLRKGQSAARQAVQAVEWDEANNLFKVNPLAEWTEDQVWDYIRQNHIPYNKLHDQGYPSIGCAPCTRAVKPGEDIRSGRWWWEESTNKECGIHNRPAHPAGGPAR